MEKLSRVSLEAFTSRLRSLRSQSEELVKEIRESRKEMVNTKRVLACLEQYNEARSWALYSLPDLSQHMPLISDKDLYVEPIPGHREIQVYVIKDDALIVLNEILLGCNTAISPLEHILKPKIPSVTLDKLAFLRKEIESLRLGLDLERNLKEAIDEAEHGHHLASALITGRAVQHLIGKTPGEKIEEKAEHIVELMVKEGMITDDKRSKKAELEQLLKAEKLSRNLISHDIHYWPKAEDPMMLLGGAIKLARLMRI